MAVNYSKTTKIRDPVYGFIELDDQEKDIINHPYFQRLRRIKQLSLTDMVYPGACHTRFEHSLGVMQMTTNMFKNLEKGSFELLGLKNEQISRTRKILRLAALLHDMGHPPFSHAGEDTMPLICAGEPDFEEGSNKKYDHEHYSRAAVRFFFRDTIENHPLAESDNISVEEILLLLGDKTVKLRRILLLLKGLISGQLDADRADYLLRDSLHLGVNYGVYDKNRLVSCVTLGKTESENTVLAVKDWRIAESLVIARYQMFSQVYFHKVRRILDFHAGMALGEVLKSFGYQDGVFPPPTSEENLKKYLEIDDWVVQGALREGKGGKHGNHIISRTPYRKVGDWEGPLTDDIIKQIELYEQKYAGKAYHVDKDVSTKWYKADENDIFVVNDNTGIVSPLSVKSQIVKAIGQPAVTRFYVSREDLSAV